MKTGQAILLLAICVVAYIELTREETKGVGEGLDDPKPQEGPRIGCTDPYARNFDAQARLFGGPEPSSVSGAIEAQVCQYDSPLGESVFNWLNYTDFEMATEGIDWTKFPSASYRDTYTANVCYIKESDEVVIRDWDAYDEPERLHPLMACHGGEIMLGIVEKAHIILDERGGLFEETEYSSGNWLGQGVSILVPKNGMRFDRQYYFDHAYDDVNKPGFPGGGQLSDYGYAFNRPTNPIVGYAYEAQIYQNMAIMRQRAEAASRDDEEYRDWVYGALWEAGNPTYGTLFDFDLDKDGRLNKIPGAAQPNELAFLWYAGVSMTQVNKMASPEVEPGPRLAWDVLLNEPGIEGQEAFGQEHPILKALDLDKDTNLSLFEYFLVGGTWRDYKKLWSAEETGLLGYDGIACSDKPVATDGIACFPFSPTSMEFLERERIGLAGKYSWFELNTQSVDIQKGYINDINICKNYEEWPQIEDDIVIQLIQEGTSFTDEIQVKQLLNSMAFDFCSQLKAEQYGFDRKHTDQVESFETATMTFLDADQVDPNYDPLCFSQSVFGQNECRKIEAIVPEDADSLMAGKTIQAQWNKGSVGNYYGDVPLFKDFTLQTEGSDYGFALPYDYAEGDMLYARNSCPSSHPYFVRPCLTQQTSSSYLGETIDIDSTTIENESET